jgi:MFS family permease
MVYAVLVASALLVDLALNLPLGSLPLALMDERVPAGSIALVIGAGPIASLAASIPIGGLTDRYGRLPVLRTAAVSCVMSVIALAFVRDPLLVAAVMSVRSIAITAYVTAEFAYASAIVAPERAVSATATLGMVGNLSFATAPAAGFWLWQHGIERQQFLWAGALALTGTLILLSLPAEAQRRTHRSRRIYMRAAWYPAIAFLIACSLASGVNAGLAIVTFHQRGVANGALLFSAMAATTFALRFFAGRLVDRFGPRIIAVPTAVVQCIGSMLAAHAQTPFAVIVAGGVMGLAWSAIVPVGIGLLFERSSKGTRGAAMGSYSLAFGIGATGGSAIGAIAAAAGPGYTLAMTICAVAALTPLPWLFRARPAGRRGPARLRLAGNQV